MNAAALVLIGYGMGVLVSILLFRPTKAYKVGVLVTLMIVFSLAYIGVKWNEREDEKKYNGGICTKCGGHYIYEQAIAHRYDTDYIYICNVCGDLIELESYRPQERKEE